MATPLQPSRANIERVTKYKISVKDGDGNVFEIGSIQSINPSESRDITPHFTLGGTNSTEPKALIDGIVRTKTFTCEYFALWKKNVISAFGAPAATDPIVTLASQTTPFTVEEYVEKADGSENITRRYEDCLISDYSATRDIGRGDVRVSERVTVVYTRVVVGAAA